MSKKNNLNTRANLHSARLKQEKEAEEKRKAKAERKQQRVAAAAVNGVAPAKKLIKKQRKGVRIKKNVVVRGIKVVDADSKRKIKEVLAAEEAMKNLMMDTEGGDAAGDSAQELQQQAKDQHMRPEKKTKKVGFAGGARVKRSSIGGKSSKGKAGKAKGSGAGAAAGEGMALD